MKTGAFALIGVVCCIAALAVQLFPTLAFSIGVDIGASWRLFGFGLFLIAISAMASSRAPL